MNRESKNITIALLLICILTMAVGYSILQQRLNVEGTANVSSVWDIQVTGIREIYKEGLAETANVNYTPTSASYTTNIKAPGDVALYEIVVENKGTLAGYASIEPNTINNITLENDIIIGVYTATKAPIEFETIEELQEQLAKNMTTNPTAAILLNKGEKAYYYAIVELSDIATKLPENKVTTNELKFTFKQPSEFALEKTLITREGHDKNCLPEGYNYLAKVTNSSDYASQQLQITITRDVNNTNETIDSAILFSIYDENNHGLIMENIVQNIDIYRDSSITEKTYTIDINTTPDIGKFTYFEISGICQG